MKAILLYVLMVLLKYEVALRYTQKASGIKLVTETQKDVRVP